MFSKKLIKNSWNYLFAKIATNGISLISIPVFTYLLTPDDYGILNIITSYVAIGVVVLTLNTQVGIGRYYFEDDEDFGSLLFMSLVFPISLLCFFFILFASNQELIASWLSIPTKTVNFIVPSILMTISGRYILQVFRAREQSKVVRNYNIAKTYFSFLAAALWIYLLSDDRYMGRLWANVLVMVVFGYLALKEIWPFIEFGLKKKHLKYLLNFSVPLIPAYLSSVILAQFDRIMINDTLGSEEAGLYSFAYNIGSLQIMVANAISYAWNPTYYKLMNKGEYEQHDKDVVNLNKLVAFSACGLILFADTLGQILGAKSYHASLYLIPIIVAGQYFITFQSFYKNHINYTKQTWLSSIVFVSGAIVNAALNLIFIPKYGAIAGAFTTLISYLIQAIMMVAVVKYILKFHYTTLSKVIAPVGLMLMVSVSYYGIAAIDTHFVLILLLKVSVLGIAALLLFGKEIMKLGTLLKNN